MKRKQLLLWISVMVITLLVGGASTGNAVVTGRCDNCHTMHNSQDGSTLDSDGPYDHLLVGGCVGCHSSEDFEQTYMLGTSTVPIVNNTSEPGTWLAGGNFFWVGQDLDATTDAMGHNVLGIAGQDREITVLEGAPGNMNSCGVDTSCHQTLAVEQDAKSNFGSGCQGCHLNVRHHTYDGGSGTKYVGAAPWYRFLAGHDGEDNVGNWGVHGIEDEDWQKTVSASDHNEYKGVSGENAGNLYDGDGTMTAFCEGCHGSFHENQDTGTEGQWTRHPSDFTIPASGEYANINSFGYDPLCLSPVARTDAVMSGFGDTPSSTVTAGSDMVMCLSCHRPHGSKYADLLRWDYSGMVAGTGTGMSTGCFYCHSEKDAG